jgi:predicted nucleotidyltransferase
MSTAHNPELQKLTKAIRPIFERYRIQKAIAFGSMARGEATRRSDLDLILVQQTEERFLDRYQGILYELNQAVQDRSVEVLIYTPEELSRIADRRFIADALREGEVIYERE